MIQLNFINWRFFYIYLFFRERRSRSKTTLVATVELICDSPF